jgi:AcrR family transcriptional regulator
MFRQDEPMSTESLAIRPPLQQRSRRAWARILDAGVALLEEGGYEAFTISAVCERAQVPPRAIYARADSKDALFLAVYDHAMARLKAEQAVFTDDEQWHDLSAGERCAKAVREVAGTFFRHAALLRAVVLISGAHPEVYRRGTVQVRELGDLFTAQVLRATADIDQPDPEAAVRAVFGMVFSALVVRTAYGPGFTAPATSDADFTDTLTTMARRCLLRAPGVEVPRA